MRIAILSDTHVNPGSPTERRRAPHPAMGIAETSEARVSFELVALG